MAVLTQDQVIELYTATFSRAADAAGVAYWMESPQDELTQVEMANAMVISEEAQALYPDTMSDDEYVTAIYNNLFNRDPEAAGLTCCIKCSRRSIRSPLSECIRSVA